MYNLWSIWYNIIRGCTYLLNQNGGNKYVEQIQREQEDYGNQDGPGKQDGR